jgi:hypothetical protein
MDDPTIWSLRQNPHGKTHQKQMIRLIIEQSIITCPYGHLGEERNNVMDGKYNTPANGQDRDFIKKVKIGHKVLITFTGTKQCIFAEVISDTEYTINTGKYYKINEASGNITIHDTGNNGGIPFRPVGRRIRIIEKNVIFPNKSYLPLQQCLQNIDMDDYKKGKSDKYNLNRKLCRNIIRELIR